MINGIVEYLKSLRGSFAVVFVLFFLCILPDFGFSGMGGALADEGSAGREKDRIIRLGRATWDTGWFQAEIFKTLLQDLGYEVIGPETFEAGDFYKALAKGEVDFWANGWFPLHNVFINAEGVKDRVEPIGHEVKEGALQGYLIDRKSAEEYGIDNLEDFRDPKIARVFDRDGDGKADLIGCNPGWGCELVIDHHIRAYGLENTVEHIKGDYTLLIYDAVSRQKQGKPVFFYTWTPNWTVGVMEPGKDVVWLEVPFESLPKNHGALAGKTLVDGVSGCGSSPCAMGWPPNDIRVVANKEFLQTHPAIRQLLQSVVIPPEDIHEQNARMFLGEGSPEDFRRHAGRWISRNKKKVKEWLEAAGSKLEPMETTDSAKLFEPLENHIKKAPLRVATMPFEPLVILDGDRYTGFSIELLEEIADEIGLEYEIYSVNSLAKILDDIDRGVADMATAGIGMTSEREQLLDFSHPFFESGLQIMTRVKPTSHLGEIFTRIMAVILSPRLLYVIGFLIFLLLVSAHVIWLSERRGNPQFPQNYLKGIWESFWWSAVTVTTVGYGDKTPRGSIGRVFALFWMFSGFFILAYFTASVTSTVTVEELRTTISGPGDLHGKLVATVKSSTAEEYLTKMGFYPRKVQNAREAFDALMAKEVDAIVYDAPVLQYFASHGGRGKVDVVGPLFWKQKYGIALQAQSPYREPINRALLKLIETGKYKVLHREWFGADR